MLKYDAWLSSTRRTDPASERPQNPGIIFEEATSVSSPFPPELRRNFGEVYTD